MKTEKQLSASFSFSSGLEAHSASSKNKQLSICLIEFGVEKCDSESVLNDDEFVEGLIVVRQHDLGLCDCLSVEVISSLNKYLLLYPEELTTENLAQLRALIKKRPKKKDGRNKQAGFSQFSKSFTPDEKEQIKKFVLELWDFPEAEIDRIVQNEIERCKRSAGVRIQALMRSKGICESCQANAPFPTDKGPYLEGHHVIPLAAGGEDCRTNVLALCPNCHRRAHCSSDRKQFTKKLKSIIQTLESREIGI